ncbi:MAG TPA: hypothetical protein P5340_07505 [Defluviicoccus sp.]|nr:hypothetical protein [Defluviicoccus sp.]
MPDAISPTPESLTAGALYRLCSELAFSDELGSTNQAIKVSKKADIVAKLEIRKRSDEYKAKKTQIDEALKDLNEHIQRIKLARELVKKAREIVQLADDLVDLAKNLIP